jgi:oxygen-independent coproporphyrinogen-3 oxidase
MEGLYIHIPFCNQKCPYCDFFSIVDRPVGFEEYFEALLRELEIYSELYGFEFKTIYFGGGTPSVVPPKVYEKFFRKLERFVDLPRIEEITMEVNPESYSLEDFKLLKEIGFNRISVGVQSFLDKNLKVLGRKHEVKHSLETLENLSGAGFENISVDLIWGLPEQTEGDLRREFEVLKNTPAVHLSAYLLTVYEETPLHRMVEKGIFKTPDEEQIERLYYTLLEETEKLNFKRYEISNFALSEEYFSKHNLLYWKLKPFLGIGASAWSFDGKKRWYNVKNVRLYVEKLKEKTPPTAGTYFLDEKELRKEAVIMGLRTTEGIPAEWIENKLPKEIIEEFFTRKGKNLAFNEKGFLVSNSILSMLL